MTATPRRATIELRLLGTVGLTAPDAQEVRAVLAQPKRLALLAYLAVARPHGFHRRDTLLALFWPEQDQLHARRALNRAVYFLRSALGDGAIVSRGDEELGLSAEHWRCDVHEFEEAVLADQPRAISLYRGGLLDGFFVRATPGFEEWLERERARLREVAADCAWALAAEHERLGQAAEAAKCGQKALELSADDEEVVRRLLRLLDRLGNRAEAIRVHVAFADRLRRGFELDPAPETQALIDGIRRSGVGSAVRPAGDGGRATPLMETPPLVGASPPAPPVFFPPDGATGTARGLVQSSSKWRRTATAATALALIAGGASFVVLARHPRSLEVGRTVPITTSRGLELDAAISPDGKLVAYAAGATGSMRIYVRHVTGGRAVSVTDAPPGEHRWPRWSPDGAQIAFASGSSIYTAPALGGPATRLVALDSNTIPLPVLPSPAWSPDGTRIAFADHRGIWVRALDGGRVTQVAQGAGLHSPTWAPDGSRIAFVSANPQFAYTATLGNPAPSSIWIADTTGRNRVRITDAVHFNASPAWGADGRHVFYVSNAGGIRDVYRQRLGPDARPISAATRMTTGLRAFNVTLSADGSRLAYSTLVLSNHIWTAPITRESITPTASARPVTSDNHFVEGIALSPDGKWLAFNATAGDGDQNIYRMPVDGGEVVRLTRDPADDFMPAWSPDGNEIAYYSLRSGYRDLYVMNADGRDVRRVTDLPGNEFYPWWSPDGRRLSFTADQRIGLNVTGRFELYVVERVTRDRWSVPLQLTSHGTLTYSRWSPDGGRILFISRDSALTVVSSGGGTAHVLVDRKTSGHVPIFPVWGPDPDVVYYQARNARGQRAFWSVSSHGGKPRLLLRFDPARQPLPTQFDTDGRRLFFSLPSAEGDVWVMELMSK